MKRAAIVGASGYAGRELRTLLARHPRLTAEVVMASRPGDVPAGDETEPRIDPFDLDRLADVDGVFVCTPHGAAAPIVRAALAHEKRIVDLSADFRLRDPETYRAWYGTEHPAPEQLASAVYGLPEISRTALTGAGLVSGVGCNATAMTLALLPLVRAGLIRRAIADVKVGSSEAGAEPSAGSHHPVRARTARTYSAFGHRHLGEVQQSLGDLDLDATVTAIDMVRGVLCTAHVDVTEPVDSKTLWKLYREAYRDEPFVRIVADRAGPNRFPDPRVVTGSNHADVGFAIDERSGRVIALAAIDNLVKGAAGSAVQSMNIALGLPETRGLTFTGLHPA